MDCACMLLKLIADEPNRTAFGVIAAEADLAQRGVCRGDAQRGKPTRSSESSAAMFRERLSKSFASQAKRANALVQARALGPEQTGRTGDIPIGLIKRLSDPLALGGVANLLQAVHQWACWHVANLERNRFNGDPVACGEYGHALDDVPELSHVAGPVVARERAHDVRVDLALSEVVAGTELGEEVGHELVEILQPFSQRRHPYRYHAEPIIEVISESTAGDEIVEPAIGG
jgi:hypothetical protein